MKRTLAILLACVLLAALAPAMAEETLTTIRVVTNDNSNNFGGNTYYLSDIVNGKLKSNRYDLLVKKLAERGLQIEWDLVTDDQYDTYLRTSLASGMNADIYCIEPLDDATRVSMAQDGYFLPLSALYPYSDGTVREYLENGDGKNRVAYQGLDGELYWSNIGGASSVRDENGDIVSASYKVEAIAKLLDFTFTEDYILLGEGYHPELEGITWVTDPEAGLAVKPPVIEGNYDNDAAQHNRNYGLWNESLPMGTEKKTVKESSITDWNPVNQAYLKEVLWNYASFICRDPLNRLCAIGTPEESELVAEYKTNLETYMNELASKLVMGERSFEDWDTYLKEMQALGLDEILAVLQARYERAQKMLAK